MVKLLKYSEKLKPLFTAKNFEEFTSILLEAVEDVDLTQPASSGGVALFAKAQSTWVRASGHGSTVSCLACDDPIGTTTSGSPFDVVLPRANAALDPNVYVNDILQYVEVNGTKYAVGTDYLDAQIGTIRELFNDDVRHGWEFCDGSGSTPDLREQFTQGAVTDAEIGDVGGDTVHAHQISYTASSVDLAAGVDTFLTIDLTGETPCAGGPVTFDEGAPIACGIATPIDHLPPWTKVYKIIRVGPSGEVA